MKDKRSAAFLILLSITVLAGCQFEQMIGEKAPVNIRGHFKEDLSFTQGDKTTSFFSDGTYKITKQENGKIKSGTSGEYSYSPVTYKLNLNRTGTYDDSYEMWFGYSSMVEIKIKKWVYVTRNEFGEIYKKSKEGWTHTEELSHKYRNYSGSATEKYIYSKSYDFDTTNFYYHYRTEKTDANRIQTTVYEREKEGTVLASYPDKTSFESGDVKTVVYSERFDRKREYDSEKEAMGTWQEETPVSSDERTFRNLGTFIIRDQLPSRSERIGDFRTLEDN